MHFFLVAAQIPGLSSRFGGGGDAGTSAHQFGLSGAARVGCCAFARRTTSAALIATTITTRILIALAIFTF